jgi:hypothetical protein
MGADIMNEVYEKLRQDVSGGGPANVGDSNGRNDSNGRSDQPELGQTVGSQSSELRVSFGGVSTTDDSINGSYEKPRSALPWQIQHPNESQERDSPRRAGLRSPPRELGNPLTRMLGPEPEPEPEPEVQPEAEPEHIAEQLRQSREQLARIQQQQQQVEESQLDLDSTAGDLSLVNGHGAKKDAKFKAKLRADNARLQEEIERLRSQLYADPTGAGPDNGPGTPTGNPSDPTMGDKAGSEQVQDLAGTGVAGDTPTDMWLAGAESPTDSEKAARQKKLDEFKRRKDAEAARRKEKHAERRKSQEIAALAAQQQAEATTAILNQVTHGEAATPEEEVDVVFGSHVSADGKILPSARLHPGIEKRRAARAAAKQASAGGGLRRETQPTSPELVADPLAAAGGGWASTAWKEHVVSCCVRLLCHYMHFAGLKRCLSSFTYRWLSECGGDRVRSPIGRTSSSSRMRSTLCVLLVRCVCLRGCS